MSEVLRYLVTKHFGVLFAGRRVGSVAGTDTASRHARGGARAPMWSNRSVRCRAGERRARRRRPRCRVARRPGHRRWRFERPRLPAPRHRQSRDARHDKRRWLGHRRHGAAGGAGGEGGRRLPERVRRRSRRSQGRPVHLREPGDPGRRADLCQRHGPARGHRGDRALHGSGPDRGAHGREGGHPLHNDVGRFDRRAHDARRLRAPGWLPGHPRCHRTAGQAGGLQEGGLPGLQRALRRAGHAGHRWDRLQGRRCRFPGRGGQSRGRRT